MILILVDFMKKELRKVIKINGVKEENHIKFKQTTKGIWYCDGLVVYNEDITKAIDESSSAMEHVVKVLINKNSGIE